MKSKVETDPRRVTNFFAKHDSKSFVASVLSFLFSPLFVLALCRPPSTVGSRPITPSRPYPLTSPGEFQPVQERLQVKVRAEEAGRCVMEETGFQLGACGYRLRPCRKPEEDLGWRDSEGRACK